MPTIYVSVYLFSFTAGENFDNDNKDVSNEDEESVHSNIQTGDGGTDRNPEDVTSEDEESGQSNIQQGDETDRNLEDVSNEDGEQGQSNIQQGNGTNGNLEDASNEDESGQSNIHQGDGIDRNLEDVSNEMNKTITPASRDMVSDKLTSGEGTENEQDSSQNKLVKDHDEDHVMADRNRPAGNNFGDSLSEHSSFSHGDGSDCHLQAEDDSNKKSEPTTPIYLFSFTAGENFDNDNKGVSNEDKESRQSNIQQGDGTDRNPEDVSNEDKESGQSDIPQGDGGTERNLEDVPNEKKKNQTDMVSDKSSTSDKGADSSQNDLGKGKCFDSHDNDEDQAMADGNKLAGDKFQSEKSNVPQGDGSGSNSSHNQRQFTVYINEGEIYQIEKWVEQFPNIETGGDLFGTWIDDRTAVVQFVLGPGRNCRRTGTSFFQDIDYLREAGTYLTQKHGLCNIGQWHSHHRLGLTRPSGGDESTVWGNMPKLGLDRYIVFIATISGGFRSYYNLNYGSSYSHEEESTVKINPYLFEIKDGRRNGVQHGSFQFMERNSPFRLDKSIGNKVKFGAETMNDVEKNSKFSWYDY